MKRACGSAISDIEGVEFMNYTSEMIEKARLAENSEELLALAKENGMEMTVEEAQKNFALLHPQDGEIADNELDNVSGGGCGGGGGDRPEPRFKIGTTVWYYTMSFGRKIVDKGQITRRRYENGVWMYQIELWLDIPENQIKYKA